MNDCYEILGVRRKARLTEIRKAFRKLARRYHPDLNPGDRRAEERFERITVAYETLADAEKRRQHDLGLEGAPAEARASRGGAAGGESGFEEFGTAGFADLFSEIFGHPPAGPADPMAPRRGDDVTRTVRLGFFDALRGTTTTVEIDGEIPCPRCDGHGTVAARHRRPCQACAGTGKINHVSGLLRFASNCRSCGGEGTIGTEGCGACRGTGTQAKRESIRVSVPAGVDDGSRVRVPAKGRLGRNGGPPGDLYLHTHVEPHPFFKRIGDNIHCVVPISVPEAALGTRIEVVTIDGRASVRIPPGTESGQKFRLRGKGAPILRGSGRGDQYVEVRVATPRAADERTRQLLRELGELDPGEAMRRDLPA